MSAALDISVERILEGQSPRQEVERLFEFAVDLPAPDHGFSWKTPAVASVAGAGLGAIGNRYLARRKVKKEVQAAKQQGFHLHPDVEKHLLKQAGRKAMVKGAGVGAVAGGLFGAGLEASINHFQKNDADQFLAGLKKIKNKKK
jgi:hypothetical protein